MRQYRFYGGLALVAVAVLMFVSRSGLSSTATVFAVIGLVLIGVSRRNIG
jgi:uncharacterized membrane protein YgdD (TMEM256/DUF423 family)